MSKRKQMWDNVLTVIMTLLCLLWVYPIALILINSLKREGTFTTSRSEEHTSELQSR